MRRLMKSLLIVAALIATTQFSRADYTPKLPSITPPAAKETVVKRRITFEEAQRMFDTLKRQHDISFEVANDGCYYRAQVMVSLLKAMYGVDAEGVWAMANYGKRKDGSSLFPDQPNLPKRLVVNLNGRQVSWWYHCAPVITVVDDDGQETKYVMDPALFDRPVTIGEWAGAMMAGGESKIPYIRVTKPGEDPTLPNNVRWDGIGQWLTASPARTMKALDGMVALRKKYQAKSAA